MILFLYHNFKQILAYNINICYITEHLGVLCYVVILSYLMSNNKTNIKYNHIYKVNIQY